MSKAGQAPSAASELTERIEEELEKLRLERAHLHALVSEGSRGDEADRAGSTGTLDDINRLDQRVMHLRDALAKASAWETSHDVVVEGSRVQVEFGPDDADEYLVGGLDSIRIKGVSLLGLDSPLGKALLGAELGATIHWDSPRGAQSARVTAIR